MKRKGIAKETIKIIRQGWYNYKGKKVDFFKEQKKSIENSQLFTPIQGEELLKQYLNQEKGVDTKIEVVNKSTVQAILDLANLGQIGVLNFASAKNPGGGFLNGAMAQEESLAASSGLYDTLLVNKEYYQANRNCNSMMYTDYAIYSPDVIFFRDKNFEFIEKPVCASVLTLPAVNYGQVLLKGEDKEQAKKVMKKRMRLALSIFAKQENKNLVLGAYGCGGMTCC